MQKPPETTGFVDNNSKLKVLILGCGHYAAIGDSPTSRTISTHAHAISSMNQHFTLVAFIDPKEEALLAASQRWNCQAYRDLEHFKKDHQDIDLVVIATPDHLHLEHIKQVLELKPRGIIVEKPISKDLSELKAFYLENNAKNIPIAVNYTRRYLPSYQSFLSRLNASEFGKFLHGTGVYSKGLLHSGSHLVNALLPVLNKKIETITRLQLRNDFSNDDPTLDCLIKYKDASYFTLQSIDSNLYEVFEIDLFFEKARVRFDNLGRRISYHLPKIYNENTCIKYIQLDQVFEEDDTSLSFVNLYKNILAAITDKKELICNIQDSIDTLTICKQIKSQK